MKNTNTCPKCQSNAIVRLPDQIHGNILPDGATIFSAVYMVRYLCTDCGFTEQWVEEPEAREKLRGRHRPR